MASCCASSCAADPVGPARHLCRSPPVAVVKRSRALYAGMRIGMNSILAAEVGGIGAARLVAWSGLALFASVLIAFGGWRGFDAKSVRRAITPARFLTAAWLLAVPPLLAWWFDPLMLDTFAVAATLAGFVLALSAIGAEGMHRSDAGPGRRWAFAGAAVLAQLAVGYLALDRAGVMLAILR